MSTPFDEEVEEFPAHPSLTPPPPASTSSVAALPTRLTLDSPDSNAFVSFHTTSEAENQAQKKGKKAKKDKKKGGSVGDDASHTGIELSSAPLHSNSSAASAASSQGGFDFPHISIMPSPPHSNTSSIASSTASAPASSRPMRHGAHFNQPNQDFTHAADSFATPMALDAHVPHFERHIDFNENTTKCYPPGSGQTSVFASNAVRTSKYTAWDFLPRNLFEQFLEPANSYFLFVGILQAIPAISTTAGIPTHYLPLAFILTVSAIRSAYEDYNRHKSDEAEGAKKYLVYDGNLEGFITKSSSELVVGDLVQMVFGKDESEQNNGAPPERLSSGPYPTLVKIGRDPSVHYSSSFPADLLFVASSHEKGHCFVETASLDGETNLKIKNAIPALQNILFSRDGGQLNVNSIRHMEFLVDCENPNARFDSFKGVLHVNPHGASPSVPQQKVMLKSDNLLLRGTDLRNTNSVYGLVVYTGADTKIRRNVRSATNTAMKKSGLMMRVNYLLVAMLCFQAALCLLGALLCFTWTERHFDSDWYLMFKETAGIAALRAFFTWFIILAQLVPISLLVSNELVKAAQAYFIGNDLSMYDATTNQPTIVRTTQLHENLGQIEYIFSDKTGTLTQNKMEFRVGFIAHPTLPADSSSSSSSAMTASNSAYQITPFGSPDSEIARRVAMRMEQLRIQTAMAHGGNAASLPRSDPQLNWTERVAKLLREQSAGSATMSVFDDIEKDKMLTALWGKKDAGSTPADSVLAKEIRMFLTHLAISNTITPELKKPTPASTAASSSSSAVRNRPAVASSSSVGSAAASNPAEEYVLNFSSPDELALCKFASHMGFQFQSRSKDGIQLSINKLGYGDGNTEVEIYQSLATLDFNSKRKRVTCIYLRDNLVYVMCKGADANVFPLIHYDNDPASLQLRDGLNSHLTDMCSKGLRTLVVASAVLPSSWWFGDGTPENEGMQAVYKATNLPDRGAEKGHHKGECRANCRVCHGLLQIETKANMKLLGATAIEDSLQALVPEAISDFLKAGIKFFMLTGDKKDTAKQIALACNLIDPDMEQTELVGSLSVEDMNRVVEVTGDWVTLCNNQDSLRQMFDILDCGGDVVDGMRTGYISKEELRYFLIGLRVPGMNDDRLFAAQWALVDSGSSGRIGFSEFVRFIKNLKPSHIHSVQFDVELGLRKARLIAGDGSEEEKRERLERTPISLVVEGEAISVFYPDTKVRKSKAKPRGLFGRLTDIAPRASPNGTNGNAAGAGASPAPRPGQNNSSHQVEEEEEEELSPPEVILLRETFFELASMCKSVIACRLTPAQKGRIVEEFGRKGHVTLAIGDGGNDELMIKKASVGVGISGLEGTAASRAADYAIPQFRMLHTLLFVHGWWCYKRISILVLFIFYKAALVALSMYFFGFMSAFSGQQWLNDVIYLLYNVCFTALPIVMLAIFDQGGLSRQTLENDPRSYLSIAHGAFFNDGIFIQRIVRAAYDAVIIFVVIYQTLGSDVSGSEGQNHGLWLTSTVVYTCVVILVTLRILFECQTINVFVAFFVILSFCSYFPIVKFCSELLTLNPNLYGTFEHIFDNGFIWLIMIFAISFPLLIDIALMSYERERFPKYHEVLQERQRLPRVELARLQQEELQRNDMMYMNNARIRSRIVPQLTQAQKDEKLLSKIKRALQQAALESDKSTITSTGIQDSQRRAEALVYTMTRLQNLSGANFDATPQRGLLSIYETGENLSAEKLEALKAKEQREAEEQTKQHEADLLRQQVQAREVQERRARLELEAAAARAHDEEHSDSRSMDKHDLLPFTSRRRANRTDSNAADQLILELDGDLLDDEEVFEPNHASDHVIHTYDGGALRADEEEDLDFDQEFSQHQQNATGAVHGSKR